MMFDTAAKVERKLVGLKKIRGWRMEVRGKSSILHPASSIQLLHLYQCFTDRCIYHIMVIPFVKGLIADGVDNV
jgi:hypothetical protein